MLPCGSPRRAPVLTNAQVTGREKRFHSAVIERVLIRDGHIAEAQYKEPSNGFFAEPKFEYEAFGGR
jgi:hypothetical protein